jgi:phosphoribosylanthranilate isomerase
MTKTLRFLTMTTMNSKHVVSSEVNSERTRSSQTLRVKVCGLRDEQNIEALLRHSLSLDALGFIFYPKSPRFVGESLRPDFMRSLGQHILTVGVFVNADVDMILHTIERFGLGAVQLHGEEMPDWCTNLRERLESNFPNVQIWKAFSIATRDDFAPISLYDGMIDVALLDTKGVAHGGNGTRFDWSLLDDYSSPTPFLLSGGIAPEHAPEIKNIQHTRLLGIDINSRFETAPALKDVGAVHRFLDELK